MTPRTLLVALGIASAVAVAGPASASARPLEAARPEAGAALLQPIPPFLRNVARRFVRQPPANLARRAGRKAIRTAAEEFLESDGEQCGYPLPETFCDRRPIAGRVRWGVGQALLYNGRPPGVWNRPSTPRSLIGALVPNAVYYLTCWTLGDRVSGPFVSTDLWYRLVSGGYVSDALLYTGTNDVITGVRHC